MATRILVVDDSPTIRSVVSMILERNGYDPKVASDGEDAYAALASGEVHADLVLVDYVMPHMNGEQFCKALRDNPELASMPVVLMSAKADTVREEFVQRTGALDAITKPFDAQALVAVIENALRRVNTGRSSARLPDVGTGEHGAVPDAAAALITAALVVLPQPAPASGSASPSAPAAPAPAPSEPRVLPAPVTRDDESPVGPPLAGDLGIIPIGAILQLLQSENQTGTLVCTSSSRGPFGTTTAEVRATFRMGVIDLVQSTGAGDEFRLGRFLVEKGVVAPGDLEAFLKDLPPASSEPGWPWRFAPASSATALEEQGAAAAVPNPRVGGGIHAATVIVDAETALSPWSSPSRTPIGMALLAASKITEPQLRAALTQQSCELLYEVLRWPNGRFELRREPPSELARSAKLGLPVASVVMEGFRRVDEWRGELRRSALPRRHGVRRVRHRLPSAPRARRPRCDRWRPHGARDRRGEPPLQLRCVPDPRAVHRGSRRSPPG